ncbi:MAG: right-handed parallel beta-helix repeat-containing protein [Planctomycetes bacterium]|nr:right-handed parallel beta-helix repeat-containing protein [Planctomycetota bacterium]MCB9935022.1 right-handed parallel beta-helix repeat-containing protein [Planctomycetota bacterium]
MRNLAALSMIVLTLVACACAGGGGGGAGAGTTGPVGSATMTLNATAGDAQISFTFGSVAGASNYTLYYDTTPGVTPLTGTPVPMPATPFTLTALSNGTTYYAVATYTDAGGESAPSAQVSATPQQPASSPYDPSWANIAPTSIVPYSGTASGLEAAMNALTPGDKMEIAAGTYNLSSKFNLDVQGTAAAPIWITPASGATVVINMTAVQNIMNIGEVSQTRYLCIRGLELTGASSGVRLYDCTQVWLDGNHIHNTGDAAITANTRDTSYIYITRNEIHNTGGTGEGMYLGANNGAEIMSNSVIALNHVHDTSGPTVTQGDGIELKQGSWGNLIAENLVHDCNYPCILVYGTAGQAQNIVERNICYNSNDNTMQIQGECIVRNNLCINGAGSAFASQVHQGNPTNLQVVHNTFVNGAGRAAKLSSWSGAANMVFANNACYSTGNWAIDCNGISGVTFAGNVCFGSVTSGISFTAGNGLSDFVNVTTNGANRDAHPAGGSALLGAANASHATPKDLEGTSRTAPHDAGCYEG